METYDYYLDDGLVGKKTNGHDQFRTQPRTPYADDARNLTYIRNFTPQPDSENVRNSASLGSNSARHISLQDPLPNVYEAKRYRSKQRSHRSQSRNHEHSIRKGSRSLLTQRDPNLYLQQQLYSEETGKYMVRAEKVKKTIQSIKKLSPTLVINLNAQTGSKNLPIKKKSSKRGGSKDNGPSMEEQKQQRWRKQNLAEPERPSFKEIHHGFTSLPIDNASLDGKNSESSARRKFITPARTKTQRLIDKINTQSATNLTLNYPRQEEL